MNIQIQVFDLNIKNPKERITFERDFEDFLDKYYPTWSKVSYKIIKKR